MQGRDDILELLLSKNANPNIGNNRFTAPLHKAPQRGEIKCLKLLLQWGADINVQVGSLFTLLLLCTN
jgi:ankyrin repeat protein